MGRYHLLLNRGAGGADRGVALSEVEDQVRAAVIAAGHSFVCTRAAPERIDPELKRIVALGPEALLVGGGDGTVATAAGYLAGSGIALGVLPMGTLNLAARDLGVPLDLAAAATFLATAPATEIDLMKVNGRACLCTLILGFYPEFSAIFERRDHGGRWWRKALKLMSTLPRFFARARPLDLRWKVPGEEGRVLSKFAAFVPGRYRETAGLVPARAGFHSGRLTAYLGSHKHPHEALRAMLDFVAGRHGANPALKQVEARSMQIRIVGRKTCKLMLDGEILRLKLPLNLQIAPSSLRVLAKLEPGS